MTPSPPPLGLRSSKEQANARAAAQLNMEDQRSRHALSARRRNNDGSERDLACQQPEESHSFCRPTSCDLARQHHQLSTGARTHKFRVSAFFSPTCCLQRNSIGGGCTGPWCSISPQSRNKGGVDHQLRSSMEGQTFCDHLQSSLIHHVRCNQVQVPDKNICRHSGTCFPANSGNSTLQGKSSSPKHSCSAACSAVVAKRIEKMATPAGARDRRQRQTKASEKQHTKEICINTCGRVRRCSSQRRSRSWTALRPQESLPRSVQKRQDCLSTVAAFNTRSCLMLPTSPHCAGSISAASWSGGRAPRLRALQLGGSKPSTPSKDHAVSNTARNVGVLPPAACCAVVAKRIEKMATPAGVRDRRQRQTKASEKQHTKEICINTCGRVRRCSSQRRSRSWTALRPQESLPRSVQKRQDCLSTVAAFNTRSCLMLPTSPHCARLHLRCIMVWRACTSAESPPTGRFKTLHSVQGPRCFKHSTQRGSVAPSLQCFDKSAQQRQGVVRGPSAMNRPSLPRMQAHWFSLRSAIPALPC